MFFLAIYSTLKYLHTSIPGNGPFAGNLYHSYQIVEDFLSQSLVTIDKHLKVSFRKWVLMKLLHFRTETEGLMS